MWCTKWYWCTPSQPLAHATWCAKWYRSAPSQPTAHATWCTKWYCRAPSQPIAHATWCAKWFVYSHTCTRLHHIKLITEVKRTDGSTWFCTSTVFTFFPSCKHNPLIRICRNMYDPGQNCKYIHYRTILILPPLIDIWGEGRQCNDTYRNTVPNLTSWV